MHAKRFWERVWLFFFPMLLLAFSYALLPQTPTFQLLILPVWVLYHFLTRKPKHTLWLAIWCAILCESMWTLPPGSCVTAFLLTHWLLKYFREFLPLQLTPYHGLLAGVFFLPLLRMWIWFYAFLWLPQTTAMLLRPSLTDFILTPAVGALGGSAVFALAAKMEFLIFKPNPKDVRKNED